MNDVWVDLVTEKVLDCLKVLLPMHPSLQWVEEISIQCAALSFSMSLLYSAQLQQWIPLLGAGVSRHRSLLVSLGGLQDRNGVFPHLPAR